jgi:PKD repeat protein
MGTATTTGENTVHTIFWAPSGYSFPAGYAATVDTFLTDVAADSGKPTNVYATDTQNTQLVSGVTSHIHYDVHYGGTLNDSDAFPTVGGCTPDSGHGETYTACIADSQLQSEVAAEVVAHGLPTGLGQLYLVFFPPNVETCFGTTNAAAGGTCSDTFTGGFCAYHSGTFAAGGLVLDGNLTYPTALHYTCMSGEAPNGSSAVDATINMVSHEHNETITDPVGSGWLDGSGYEIGDECGYIFGPVLGGAPGNEWDQVINGDHYFLQDEFSNGDYADNASAGCIAAEDVPTAAFSVTTPAPSAGSPVAFTAASADPDASPGIATYAWDFGDGSATGSGATPFHTYAAAGTLTATLTVTDVDGWTGSVSHVVDVGSAVTSSPAFTADSPPVTATVGNRYSSTFAASGYPVPTYALAAGAPHWLSIGTGSGVLGGTPPAGTTTFSYSVVADNGVSPDATAGPFTVKVTTPAKAPPPVVHGYWLVGADGGIFTFGSARFHGSTGSFALQRPVAGITPTTDRGGYWLVASDGGIFAFGDAGFHGSIPGLGIAPAGTPGAAHELRSPIVGMVPSADGGGYFMVAGDGGVFAFGDARFAGSCPGIGGCSGTAVAVMPDASGNGYWLVTGTGNVYAFGDAPHYGAPGFDGVPVTSAVRTPDGRGYWILFAYGTVAAYGDARPFGGPVGGVGPFDPATAVFTTADGNGYWVASSRGGVFAFGDAPNDGSMAGVHLNSPVIAATGW